MPKVSIIVPNYNYARFLPERMESIFSQTFQDFEIILLDDCSTDNSRELLKEYAKHEKVTHCVFNEKNSGSPFAQWDKGIRLAQGRWIWIAEADDVANVNFLEEMVNGAEKYPTIGLAYCHLNWIDADSRELFAEGMGDKQILHKGKDFLRDKLLYETTIYNVSSALFRKDVLMSVDWTLFNKMKMCGDYYLYTLLAEKCDVLECEKILDSYRQHGENTSGRKLTSLGWGLIEGMPILDRIVKKNNIPQKKYAQHYARLWYKSHLLFKVNLTIAKKFLPNHWMVVFYFVAYNFKNFIKR